MNQSMSYYKSRTLDDTIAKSKILAKADPKEGAEDSLDVDSSVEQESQRADYGASLQELEEICERMRTLRMSKSG